MWKLVSREMTPSWPWEGRALAVLFGLGLILWPFLSFGAIFLFDSPIQSRSDLVGRYTVAYFIWFYPLTYALTLLLYYVLHRYGVWRLLSCLAWIFPGVAYFVLPTVAGWRNTARADAKRIQLLFRTDYNAVLIACREVMTHRTTLNKLRAMKPAGMPVPTW
jgi:hypothetical protein